MGKQGRARRSRHRGSAATWLESPLTWVAGAAVLALIFLPALELEGTSHHPEPRDTIDHSHVAPASRYAAAPRVAETYTAVAAIPHVIDGIYCYCNCSEHSGHHSLLDCFHDDHAARCDVCLSEAAMASRMHADGHSIGEIRAAIDELYQT